MLVENINCYVCDCAEEICPTYVAELRVTMFKYNIKMDIKEIAIKIKQTEFNLILILRSHVSATIFDRKWWISWPVD